jgi:hypothetical protein
VRGGCLTIQIASSDKKGGILGWLRRYKNHQRYYNHSKGVPVEVPVRFRGDELTDLIVYAIASRLTEKPPFSDLGNAKIAKIVYDVADKLDLPITRSWYKFGTYVWSDYANLPRMKVFQNQPGSDLEASYTIQLSQTKDKDTFDEIEKIVSKHKMLGMSLSAFLDELYEKAPSKYRGLYRSHREVLMRLQRITKALEYDKEFPVPQFTGLSRDITGFQKEMFAFEDRPEMVDMVIDYTNFLEDLVVKYDEIFSDNRALRDFIPFFSDAYKCYSDDIWSFPPSVIAIETVKGENEDIVKANRSKHLTEISNYLGKSSEMREAAFLLGFFPSQSEILQSQAKLVKQLGSGEEALVEDFVRTVRQPDQE